MGPVWFRRIETYAPVTFSHTDGEIFEPPALLAVRLMDQFPALKLWVGFRLTENWTGVPHRFVIYQFHDVGLLVLVSVNAIT